MDQMIKLTKEEITALKHVVQELARRMGEDEIGTFIYTSGSLVPNVVDLWDKIHDNSYTIDEIAEILKAQRQIK